MARVVSRKRLLLLLALALLGVGLWLLVARSGGGAMDSPDHPFRSARAKERYLTLYDRMAADWPVASETRTVLTSYGSTFVRISGPRSAPPLVLLHGGGGNSLQWAPNIEAFSRLYRTYAPDNIYDNGRSVFTRPVETADDMVAWLAELVDGLGLSEDIRIVGLSYGGWIASQFAVRFPEQVERMVLIAPAGAIRPLRGEWIARAILCVLPHRYFTRRFLYWLAEDAVADEMTRRRVDQWVEHGYVAIRSFKFKQLVNPTVLTDDELRGLAVPTLFLVGENEKTFSSAEAVDRLRAVAAQIEVSIVLGAGHDLTLVATEVVNEKVLEFLGRSGDTETRPRAGEPSSST